MTHIKQGWSSSGLLTFCCGDFPMYCSMFSSIIDLCSLKMPVWPVHTYLAEHALIRFRIKDTWFQIPISQVCLRNTYLPKQMFVYIDGRALNTFWQLSQFSQVWQVVRSKSSSSCYGLSNYCNARHCAQHRNACHCLLASPSCQDSENILVPSVSFYCKLVWSLG